MKLYDEYSQEAAARLTQRYSTSFGLSIRLFTPELRPHIYAIYGLVRIADEIVDTYMGPDSAELLDELQADVQRALSTGYSTNPIVHAFAATARQYDINDELIGPFFESMRMDLHPEAFTQESYERYIHGSAEVIGLMCLKVFVNKDQALYDSLRPGAQRLGAAYQKINFLRDIASDAEQRGRWYFPEGSFETFDDAQKTNIINDIEADVKAADEAVRRLPKNARRAVKLSIRYYHELLEKLHTVPAEQLLQRRVRVPNGKKLLLFAMSIYG